MIRPKQAHLWSGIHQSSNHKIKNHNEQKDRPSWSSPTAKVVGKSDSSHWSFNTTYQVSTTTELTPKPRAHTGTAPEPAPKSPKPSRTNPGSHTGKNYIPQRSLRNHPRTHSRTFRTTTMEPLEPPGTILEPAPPPGTSTELAPEPRDHHRMRRTFLWA